MKVLKCILFTMFSVSLVYGQLDTNSRHFYLFSYFLNGGTTGTFLAISSDGLKWETVNNGKPVLTPTVASSGTPLMRDPAIIFDSDKRIFHMVWTPGWSDPQIGYASSTDLLTWKSQKLLQVMKGISGVNCSWAPEILWDDIQGKFMIYWSSELSTGVSGKRTWYCTTSDFTTLSSPQKMFDPGYSVIDADIIKVSAGKYFMCFKNEMIDTDPGRRIYSVTGSTPQGPWSAVSNAFTDRGVEGPCTIKMADSLYYMYFDPYSTTKTYRLITSTDLVTWKKGPEVNLEYSHAVVIEIPREYVMWLKYKHPLPTTGTVRDTRFKAVNAPHTSTGINGLPRIFDLSGKAGIGKGIQGKSRLSGSGCFIYKLPAKQVEKKCKL